MLIVVPCILHTSKLFINISQINYFINFNLFYYCKFKGVQKNDEMIEMIEGKGIKLLIINDE